MKRDIPHHEHAAREHRRKHVATWVAAGGTLAVVVALWAMLLPTSLGGTESFGVKHSPSWMVLPKQAGEPSSFQEALDRTGAMLDRVEGDQRARAEREQAASQGADALRAKIEAPAAQPPTDGADQATQ